ncbi:TetR/AcrR family transcriptional regulator [Rhodococcus erythropolis]
MARYDTEHKAQTRARVVDAAGRRLKKDGIDGSGVSALMSDAGLTNGAFYAHFSSKDELVAVVLADQLATQLDTLRGLSDDGQALRTFIESYLSASHRDQPEVGCPSAALLGEISRSNSIVQQSYTDGLEAMISVVADRTRIKGRVAARSVAIGVMSILIGALQLSRSVSDPGLSDEILSSGLVNASLLLQA